LVREALIEEIKKLRLKLTKKKIGVKDMNEFCRRRKQTSPS